MPTVPIEEVQAGDILLKPIEDSMGRVLITAGESLTDQLINVLKRRGYVELDIRASESQSISEEISARMGAEYSEQVQYDSDVLQMKDEVSARFHNVAEDDRNMQIIRSIAENILIGRIVARKGLK